MNALDIVYRFFTHYYFILILLAIPLIINLWPKRGQAKLDEVLEILRSTVRKDGPPAGIPLTALQILARAHKGTWVTATQREVDRALSELQNLELVEQGPLTSNNKFTFKLTKLGAKDEMIKLPR